MSRQLRTKRAKWCRFISIITGKLLYIKKRKKKKEKNEKKKRTVIISITKDVLLDVLILSGMVLVFHPQRNGEILGKIMRHHFRRDRGAC